MAVAAEEEKEDKGEDGNEDSNGEFDDEKSDQDNNGDELAHGRLRGHYGMARAPQRSARGEREHQSPSRRVGY